MKQQKSRNDKKFRCFMKRHTADGLGKGPSAVCLFVYVVYVVLLYVVLRWKGSSSCCGYDLSCGKPACGRFWLCYFTLKDTTPDSESLSKLSGSRTRKFSSTSFTSVMLFSSRSEERTSMVSMAIFPELI